MYKKTYMVLLNEDIDYLFSEEKIPTKFTVQQKPLLQTTSINTVHSLQTHSQICFAYCFPAQYCTKKQVFICLLHVLCTEVSLYSQTQKQDMFQFTENTHRATCMN